MQPDSVRSRPFSTGVSIAGDWAGRARPGRRLRISTPRDEARPHPYRGPVRRRSRRGDGWDFGERLVGAAPVRRRRRHPMGAPAPGKHTDVIHFRPYLPGDLLTTRVVG